jgi:hypothetical protein
MDGHTDHDGVLASGHACRMQVKIFEGPGWREPQGGGQGRAQRVLKHANKTASTMKLKKKKKKNSKKST